MTKRQVSKRLRNKKRTPKPKAKIIDDLFHLSGQNIIILDGGGNKNVDLYFSANIYEWSERSGFRLNKNLSFDRYLIKNMPEILLPNVSFERKRVKVPLTPQTNMIAEYCALFFSLERYIDNYDFTPMRIYHDCQTVVNQVLSICDDSQRIAKGYQRYNCESPHLKLWLKAIDKIWFDDVDYYHVKREFIVKELGH